MAMDSEVFSQLGLALPAYLTIEDKQQLLSQLRRYPQTANYYGYIPNETEPVQGDGWRGFISLDFDTGQRDLVVGIVLSNSCDIARSNGADPDQQILFAPVLDLALYLQFLAEAGKTDAQVVAIRDNIRKQSVHRLFYLPAIHGLYGESVVMLDAIHAQPLRSVNVEGLERIWTLSTFGWYILLFKLSVHFTRMSEATSRKDIVA